MTQEQALAEFQLLRPESRKLRVERTHCIGYQHGVMNSFYLWDHSEMGMHKIVASSDRSWEHALAIAKSGNEECWPEDNSFDDVADKAVSR